MAKKTPTNYTDLAASIFVDIVAPDYQAEIKDVVTWRRWWSKIANFSEGIAHVFLGVATILAYAAGFFDNKYISFAAGCCSTLCLALLRFSVYANRESDSRNTVLNRLLAVAGLSPDPSITADGKGGADDPEQTTPSVAPIPAATRVLKRGKPSRPIHEAVIPVATRVEAAAAASTASPTQG